MMPDDFAVERQRMTKNSPNRLFVPAVLSRRRASSTEREVGALSSLRRFRENIRIAEIVFRLKRPSAHRIWWWIRGRSCG
jgi:hypothetical protein